MDILHWVLLATTFICAWFAAGVLLLAHHKICQMKFNYDLWIADAECEIEKAQRAMNEALKYEMAGEALRGEEDYFDG